MTRAPRRRPRPPDTRPCEHCGELFTAPTSRRQYCTTACKNAAGVDRRARLMLDISDDSVVVPCPDCPERAVTGSVDAAWRWLDAHSRTHDKDGKARRMFRARKRQRKNPDDTPPQASHRGPGAASVSGGSEPLGQ